MATAQQFEDLGVWPDARQTVREVYQIPNQRAFRRDFSLRNQLIRALTSTMSNIVQGSNGEVRSQLYVALDLAYIDEETFNALKDSALKLSRRLAKFIAHLKTCPTNARVRPT